MDAGPAAKEKGTEHVHQAPECKAEHRKTRKSDPDPCLGGWRRREDRSGAPGGGVLGKKII